MPGPPRQPGPVDPTVAAIAAKFGIDPATLAVGGGGSDDPPIYYGREMRPAGYDTELKARNQAVDKIKPMSAYLNDFYGMGKDALTQWQQRAYQAGLYGNAKPRYGDHNDDVAFEIWKDIGRRAAGFNAAGQKFTPGDVLDMAVQSTPQAERQVRAYQTRTDIIQTQDPSTVRQAAHAAFKAATGRGRKIGDPVVEKFIAAFTAEQTGAQRTVNRAQDQAELTNRARQEAADAGLDVGQGPVSQEVRVAAPDLQSSVDEYVQNAAPAEVGAHNVTKQFDGFLKILGGIV